MKLSFQVKQLSGFLSRIITFMERVGRGHVCQREWFKTGKTVQAGAGDVMLMTRSRRWLRFLGEGPRVVVLTYSTIWRTQQRPSWVGVSFWDQERRCQWNLAKRARF